MNNRIQQINLPDQTTTEVGIFEPSKANNYTILLLPALGVWASYYKGFATALAEQGYTVVTADWRGNGLSPVRASRVSNWGYETLIRDTEAVLRYIKTNYSDKETILLGHSLGGQLGSLLTAQLPDMIKGICLIASCNVHYVGWKGNLRFLLKSVGYLTPIIGNTFGYFPGKTLGFGGKEARGVMSDWAFSLLKGQYIPKDQSFDYEQAIGETIRPILAISIDKDHLAPRKAVENLYKKLHISSPVEHRHIGTQETEIQKLDHFTWAKHPEHFVPIIHQWISNL